MAEREAGVGEEEEEEEEAVVDLTGSGDEEEEAAGVPRSRTDDDDDVCLSVKPQSSHTGSRNNAERLLPGSYDIVLCVDFIETTG